MPKESTWELGALVHGMLYVSNVQEVFLMKIK